MMQKNIQRLTVKFIDNSISARELDELEVLLRDCNNEKHFLDFIKENYLIDYSLKEFHTNESKKLLLQRIRTDKSAHVRHRFRKVLKYAAIAVLLLVSGYFLKLELYTNSKDFKIAPKESFITLELDNGNIKVIAEDGSSIVKDSDGKIVGNQVGNKMVYVKKTSVTKLVYNTLNVPYGKRFKLELSDSTMVYLNAGSSIKYPVNFLEGREREVILIGEAFLAVTEDKEHPFIVKSGDLDIKVLGTEFNLTAYPEDNFKEVVLVKGSVELFEDNQNNNNDKTILKPGMKGNFDIEQKKITTEPVITSIYTSWVDGELVFRNMTFGQILKKLERHYNVTIINNNKNWSEVEFNASFTNMPIGQVMGYFKSVYGIEFTENPDKIIIKN